HQDRGEFGSVVFFFGINGGILAYRFVCFVTSQGIKQIRHKTCGLDGSVFLLPLGERFNPSKEQQLFEMVCDFVNRKFKGPGLVGTAKPVKPEASKLVTRMNRGHSWVPTLPPFK